MITGADAGTIHDNDNDNDNFYLAHQKQFTIWQYNLQ